MLPSARRAVNRAVPTVIFVAAACTPPAPTANNPSPPAIGVPSDPIRIDGPSEIGGHLGDALPDRRRKELAPGPLVTHALDGNTGVIEGAQIDMSLGTRLEAALDELNPRLVDQLGVSALTFEQIVGTEANDYTDALCEPPEATFSFDEQGQTWDARVGINSYFDFVGDIEAVTDTLDEACIDALDDNGGDVDAAVAAGACADFERQEFFREGSTCRECVTTASYDACVATEACADESVSWTSYRQEDGSLLWYQQYQALMFACAPDYLTRAILLVDPPEDGSAPRPWDHRAWAYLVLAFWDEAAGEVAWYPLPGEGGPEKGGTLVEGLWGHTRYIRREGEEGAPWAERQYFVHDLEVNNAHLRWSWGYNPGSGAVSMDPEYTDVNGDGTTDGADAGFGYSQGFAFGLRPTDLRPDGETKARDYVGAVLMKSATTSDGALISIANHSRCEAWDGPDAAGAWRCASLGPAEAGWANDAESARWNDTQVYHLPMATLASSGAPDPTIPGGFVTWMAGSPALADPEWDDCAWEQQFTPDIARFGAVPQSSDGGLDGHVYKFGKDTLDIRVVLNTNRLRGFCPAGP